jgi:hypothetical protein
VIPEEKSAAVSRGLREAFGVTRFDEIRSLKSGPSAVLVFRIVVRGSPYLLRIILRADDATRHFDNMRAAAEAGLTPRVWYTNAPDKVSITDFVEAVPFPLSDALFRMPAALRGVHALPPFARVPNHINTSCMFLLNRGPALDGFVRMFQAANVVPRGECEEAFAKYAQVTEIYPHGDGDMVSSHNDLKPENILFDGQRVWLVDWEAAFLNDRYADLAVVANSVVGNEAEERIYLEAYFGQPPDAYQQARFFLVRQVAHLFYAMAYLLKGASGGPVSLTGSLPGVTEFHRRIWFDEMHLDDAQLQSAYGRAHWTQFLENTRRARFQECLRIVAEEGK